MTRSVATTEVEVTASTSIALMFAPGAPTREAWLSFYEGDTVTTLHFVDEEGIRRLRSLAQDILTLPTVAAAVPLQVVPDA